MEFNDSLKSDGLEVEFLEADEMVFRGKACMDLRLHFLYPVQTEGMEVPVDVDVEVPCILLGNVGEEDGLPEHLQGKGFANPVPAMGHVPVHRLLIVVADDQPLLALYMGEAFRPVIILVPHDVTQADE